MPSGAAVLVAMALILWGGFGSGSLRRAGLRSGPLAAWCLATAAASVLNLHLPWSSSHWQPLWNPGGTLLPLAFAASLRWTGPRDVPRPGASVVICGILGGASLAGAAAWAGTFGWVWPQWAIAAGVGATLVPAADGGRSLLAAAALALPATAAATALMAAAGWCPWPAAIGGGLPFDLAVFGLACSLVVAGIRVPRRLTGPLAARAGTLP